jgi:hypothetical protein
MEAKERVRRIGGMILSIDERYFGRHVQKSGGGRVATKVERNVGRGGMSRDRYAIRGTG